jgi:hypothetical protein
MALLALLQHTLLLQKANGGVAIGGVSGVAGDAAAGVGIGLLPTGQRAMKVPVKVLRVGRVGVALEAMGIIEGLSGDGGLGGCAREPLNGIVCA